MRKVFIWTDIGTNPDDILAILMALRSSEIEVVGIETCHDQDGQRFHLLKEILKHEGKNVPVGQGSFHPQELYFKREYLGPEQPLENQGNIENLFLEILSQTPELEVLTLGPLTEFSAALSLQPELEENISCWTGMGGSIEREEEFNFCSDPQATRSLLATRIPKKIIPLELGRQFFIDEKEIGRLKICHEVKEFILQSWHAWQKVSGRETFYLCDPVAVASFLGLDSLSYKEGEIILGKDKGHWFSSFNPSPKSLQVAIGVDRSSFFEFFYDLLR